ncbi:MAG: FxsA family protein [Pseudomonadota bacterium]
MPLFLILMAVPLIEIALFVTIGERIGLWWTLASVVVTAVVGTIALRSQGFALLRRAMSAEAISNAPDLLSEGALVLVAGVMLLTPGFLTDAIGLGLLVPPIRRMAARFVVNRSTIIVSRRRADGADRRTEQTTRGPETRSHPQSNDRSNPSRPHAPSSAGLRSRPPRPGAGDVEDAVEIDPKSSGSQQ